MTIHDALIALGAGEGTLSPTEKDTLDRDGFLIMPSIITPAQVDYFRARMDELLEAEGEDAGKEVHQEVGTERLADLVNKDLMFQLPVFHPRVLAAAAHVLAGDIKLFSLNSRSALPGYGAQDFHKDVNEAWNKEFPNAFMVCNSAWLLDDFTAQNGATRVIPGSHLWPNAPSQVLEDLRAPHPQEQLVMAPAGTVVVFNSHVWHSGTQNNTKQRRRAMYTSYCRRHLAQLTDQKAVLRPETAARLSEATRCIMDV